MKIRSGASHGYEVKSKSWPSRKEVGEKQEKKTGKDFQI